MTKREQYDQHYKHLVDQAAVALRDAGFNFCLVIELDAVDEGDHYAFQSVSVINLKSDNCLNDQVNPQLLAAVAVAAVPEFAQAVAQYAEDQGIIPSNNEEAEERASEVLHTPPTIH